jgi:hypothetical protein
MVYKLIFKEFPTRMFYRRGPPKDCSQCKDIMMNTAGARQMSKIDRARKVCGTLA